MPGDQGLASHRDNDSFLAGIEQSAIRYLVMRLPLSTTPLQLTLTGLAGGILVGASLAACSYSLAFLPLVLIGLLVNWFGDSLDGSLARARGIERPRFGFLVDHSTDLIAQVAMIIGFGCSPFLSMTSALVILVMYLLFSGYTYILVTVEKVHHLSYGGVGATEFRIIMGLWAIIGAAYGPSLLTPTMGLYSNVDLVVASLSIAAVFLLAGTLIRDGRRIAAEEGVPQPAFDGRVVPLTARKRRNSA